MYRRGPGVLAKWSWAGLNVDISCHSDLKFSPQLVREGVFQNRQVKFPCQRKLSRSLPAVLEPSVMERFGMTSLWMVEPTFWNLVLYRVSPTPTPRSLLLPFRD